jgi:hypothetical protein
MISGWWLVVGLVALSMALTVLDSVSEGELNYRKQSIAFLFGVATLLAGLLVCPQFGRLGLLVTAFVFVGLWFGLLRISVVTMRYKSRWQLFAEGGGV